MPAPPARYDGPMIQRSALFAARALALCSIIFVLTSSSLRAQSLFDDGLDPELLEAIEALEYAPNDVARLEATARVALESGEPDMAFWYASLALAQLPDDSKSKKTRKALEEFRAQIEVPGISPEELQEEMSREVFAMARACEKKKLYANAADLLQLCIGTAMQARAEARLQKMFSKKKAIQALIESGIDFEVPGGKRVNKKTRAQVNKKNTTWEKAYEIKGRYYILRSDMGYDYTHAFLDAMEQMNAFYRGVFNYKVRGGTMRSCRIDVYKNREAFDKNESKARGETIDPNVKGFFVPDENRVATYDPRSEGGTIDDLWSTLFHEASHQFTAAVLPGLELTWLNEGTASYFEGAFMQPGGSVAKNRIPRTRLRSLYSLIGFRKGKSLEQRMPRGDAPTLEDVITYYGQGSYDGAYYPYGWGLVYFFHNFEDENSERVYLPIYKEFMLTYKSGGAHDIKGRFVEYFVEKAGVDGVESFDDFEEQWMTWIRDLYDLHYGGPEKASLLVEKGLQQLENEKPAYALDSFRWALEKNPKNNQARMHYAEAAILMERWDLAAFHWRKLESQSRRFIDQDTAMPGMHDMSAGEVRTLALEQLGVVNPRIRDGLVNSVDAFVERAQAVALSFVDEDFPLSALYLLESSSRLVGGDARLLTAALEIEEETDVSLTRGFRPTVTDDLDGWSARSSFSARKGVLRVTAEPGINTATIEDTPSIPFRWEATIELSGKEGMPIAGISFGTTETGSQRVAWLADMGQMALLVETTPGGGLLPSNISRVKSADPRGVDPSRTKIHLAIEVLEDQVIFYANGHEVFDKDFSPTELRGRVGVFVQGANATFTNLRFEY